MRQCEAGLSHESGVRRAVRNAAFEETGDAACLCLSKDCIHPKISVDCTETYPATSINTANASGFHPPRANIGNWIDLDLHM